MTAIPDTSCYPENTSTTNGKQAYLSYPLNFSLDNFPRAYEDSNYLVLEVPPLKPPRASSPSSQSQSVSLHEDGSSRHNDVSSYLPKRCSRMVNAAIQ